MALKNSNEKFTFICSNLKNIFYVKEHITMPANIKILNKIRKILPPLSRTEREALESGTVGWDGGLLSGTPDWEGLSNVKKPKLTDEEQSFVDNETNELCKMLDTQEINKLNDLPENVWQFIKEKGFFGLEIPKEKGGKGFSALCHSQVILKIASRNITAAVTVMVPNSLGPAKLIEKYGTQEQKDHYLPRLAKGQEVPCFALTEPNAGSDAGAMQSKGIVCKGENGEIGISLTFDKRYITLAPIATLAGLAFNLFDPEGLLGDEKELGITLALLPRDTKGLKLGDRHKPMDIPFMNGTVKGENVFIPMSQIIGGKEQVGNGWKMLMECLAIGRGISLTTLSVAGAKLSSYTSGAYARIRRQFNTDIANFEGIEEALARIAGETHIMQAALSTTLQMIDQGESPAIPSAVLKYHLTERLRNCVNDAMDIHGGKAIINGPNNYFIDTYKGIPVAITVEGANIMTRNLIIFGQGIVRSHPYLLKEIEALGNEDDNKAWEDFTALLKKHILSVTKNLGKSVAFGLLGFGGSTPDCAPQLKMQYRKINRMSAAFAFTADATLGTLGGALKRKERISARLGDVYSAIYLASCVLWQYEVDGRPEERLAITNWACTNLLYKAEQSLSEALRNHPLRWLGLLIRPLIFPTGLRYKNVSDKMDHLAAKAITESGSLRDDLTKGMYLPEKGANEALADLANAFAKRLACEEIEKKISKAKRSGELDRSADAKTALEKGVITAEELKAIEEADTLKAKVIAVDSFPAEAF